MMLRIGSKFRCSVFGVRCSSDNRKPITDNRGFTLVEVMVTAAVLSLGVVLIYEALFKSLDAFRYCENYIVVAPLIQQKLWQAQDDLESFGKFINTERSGSFTAKNKEFNWSFSSECIDTSPNFNLYKINLTVFWQESSKQAKILRTAYALYRKE